MLGSRVPTSRPMNPFLVRSVVFPLQEALKGHSTIKLLGELEESQHWDRQRLRDYRVRRLKAFLQTAQSDVPHYRDAWRAIGFDAGRMSELEDVQRLPFLTRETIQESRPSLESSKHRGRTQLVYTGGSTGVPVGILADTSRAAFSEAARIRCQRWFGVDIGDPEVVVWGSPIELGRQDRLRSVRDALLNTHLISAFNWTEENVVRALKTIASRRPSRMYGYAQSIAYLAQRADDMAFSLTPAKVIFVTAEPLYDFQRERIRKTLGESVAAEYGARDAGLIGQECPEGTLHINAEGVLVEIVDDDGAVVPDGESGEIVITNWDTPAMPFIRYRTGDVGAVDTTSCPCGVSLPALKDVTGRMSDFLHGADGRRIHPLGAIYVLREMPMLKQFRIVQHSLSSLELQLVARAPLKSSDRDTIQRKFEALLGSSVDIRYSLVDSIPSTASGKFRYVESRVEPSTNSP